MSKGPRIDTAGCLALFALLYIVFLIYMVYFKNCLESFHPNQPIKAIPSSKHDHDLPHAQQEPSSFTPTRFCCFVGTIVYIAH